MGRGNEWFTLNVNENGLEIVHRDPPGPQCDAPHTLEDVRVDTLTVASLIEDGEGAKCKHCFPPKTD